MAEKIRTIVVTGALPQLDELEERLPAELSEMMKLSGLGPKRVKALHQDLGIETLEDLRQAVDQRQVRGVPGLGPKTERKIGERLAAWQGDEPRTRLIEAEEVVRPFVDYLKGIDGVKNLRVAGSFRRRKETVGDLDILVTAKRGTPLMERFSEYDEVSEVASRGETRSTVILGSGMQVDLRLVPQVSFGAALHYFTGSKGHNIAARRMGVEKGLKINEYGVFRGDDRVAGRTEEEAYESVGLPYIEPELREDRGELRAAKEGRPAAAADRDRRYPGRPTCPYSGQ